MRKLFKSDFVVTQHFGANPEWYKPYGLIAHEGLDLIPKDLKDWSVLALEDGVVVKDDDIAGDKRLDPYGKSVTIWHPKLKKATQYCHLATNYVQIGQTISKSDIIGKMGATGNSNGAHVHLNLFETDEEGYRKNTNNGYNGGIDPLPFLNEEEKVEQKINVPMEEMLPKRVILKDIIYALTGQVPTEDNLNWWISRNMNIYEMTKEIAEKDGNFVKLWKTPLTLATISKNDLLEEVSRRIP